MVGSELVVLIDMVKFMTYTTTPTCLRNNNKFSEKGEVVYVVVFMSHFLLHRVMSTACERLVSVPDYLESILHWFRMKKTETKLLIQESISKNFPSNHHGSHRPQSRHHGGF
jgi:hypothetical protein